MQFGLYLKYKGVISAEQLVHALEVQDQRLVPIGQLAIEEGVLSVRDVFKVLHCQGGLPHDRFGEIAVDMGMMKLDQLQRLLMVQSSRKLPLVDILVRLRVLTPDRAEEELAAYRRQLELRSIVVTRRIPNGPHLSATPTADETVDIDYYAMMI